MIRELELYSLSSICHLLQLRSRGAARKNA